MEEIPSINCCICYSDTTSYAIIRCRHKIGIVCFLTMIKNRDYRCPICREVFTEIIEDDPEDESIDYPIENLNDEIQELRRMVVQELQPPSRISSSVLDKFIDQNFNNNCLAFSFILLMLLINNVFRLL